MNQTAFAPASELVRLVRTRQVSPIELVESALARIDDLDPQLKAFVTVLPEPALEAARAAEAAVMSNTALGPLHGVPVAIKDLEPMAGVRNTCGSLALADRVARVSAPHVSRLEEAGAIVVGTTNVPEFGCQGTTDNYVIGATASPFGLATNAGGSSGGSAAAVGGGLVPVAQGSDGGGSVRIPAALCGVVGLIGTAGRVPIATRPDGFHSRAHFTNIGALGRTVADAALMQGVMSAPDDRDPLGLPAAAADGGQEITRAKGLTVAYCPTFGGFPVEPEVDRVSRAAVEALAADGAEVVEVEIDFGHDPAYLCDVWRRGVAVSYGAMVESYREEGIDLIARRDELTPSFCAYLDLAADLSAVAYKLDDKARTRVFDAVQGAFRACDVIATPTVGAASIENRPDGHTVGPRSINGHEVDELIGWCLTYPINFSGHPAASVPSGFTSGGAPVGLQLVGPRFHDATVIRACLALEHIRPWADAYERSELAAIA